MIYATANMKRFLGSQIQHLDTWGGSEEPECDDGDAPFDWELGGESEQWTLNAVIQRNKHATFFWGRMKSAEGMQTMTMWWIAPNMSWPICIPQKPVAWFKNIRCPEVQLILYSQRFSSKSFPTKSSQWNIHVISKKNMMNTQWQVSHFSQSCKGTTGGMTYMTLMWSPKTPQSKDIAIPNVVPTKFPAPCKKSRCASRAGHPEPYNAGLSVSDDWEDGHDWSRWTDEEADGSINKHI